MLRVSEPRRHLPHEHRGLHRFRPRPDILKCEERHRRHLPWTMTGLTIPLQNRLDIFMKRDRAIGSERYNTGHQKR
jgi:hypothetical protein